MGETVKTENSLKTRNQLYYLSKYHSNFSFQKWNSVLKQKTFTNVKEPICFSSKSIYVFFSKYLKSMDYKYMFLKRQKNIG